MKSIPLELFGNIILFLSLKEKINVRKVNSVFRYSIKMLYLLTYRLENQFLKSHSIEERIASNLILTTSNNFTFYTDYKKSGVHSLFRINNHEFQKCINANCREKKVGDIYFSKQRTADYSQKTYNFNCYSKRKIHYCLNCFNRWNR